MKKPGESIPERRGSLTAIDDAMALIIVLLMVQMWLLSAALESFLSGHREVALPAAIVSGVILLGCFALYLFVIAAERGTRE
jgi:predicted Co/Zn/Cd cation transporter (cation efflux family)